MCGLKHPRWVETKYKKCLVCPTEFICNKTGRDKTKKYCSIKCAALGRSLRALPLGTKKFGSEGYWLVKVSARKWDYEHRVLAEQELGRKLRRDELVHHVNGIPSDNRKENRAVMTNSEHQRVHHEAELIGLQVMAYENAVADRMIGGC